MLVKWVLSGVVGLAWASGSSTPLSSSELLELVPKNAEFGGEPLPTRRFSWHHLVRLLRSKPQPQAHHQPEILQDPGLGHYQLGERLFYGIGTQQNLAAAAAHFKQAADEGDAEGQFMTAVAYSTGLFGNHPKNEAMATLYYTMSAVNGATRGQVAAGYRYLNGLGMPKDTFQAYNYLSVAGHAALDYTEDREIGLGYKLDARLDFVAADEFSDGLYGNSSSLYYLRRTPLREMLVQWDSVEEGLQYLEFHAYSENRASPLMFLLQAHVLGGYTGVPDYKAAIECAQELIKRTKNDQTDDGRWKRAWAHGFIGNCYRRGDGVPYDLEKAEEYYNLGLDIAPQVDNDNAPGGKLRKCRACYDGLAVIELHRINGDVSSAGYEKVRELFLYGSLLFHPHSEYMMGRDLYMQQFYQEAIPLLKRATSTLPQPYFLLSEIYDSHAKLATSPAEKRDLHKKAAESLFNMFEFVQDFYSPMRFAQIAWSTNTGAALAAYLVCAELGITSAQVNLADILDVDHSWLNWNKTSAWALPSFVHPEERAPMALKYFALAGHGHDAHLDSLNKVAEYYFSGKGTAKDPKRAAAIYQALIRQSRSALAFWALGWMHEHGLGMIPDFHLAKRYYDSAVYYSPNSYIAIKLSLAVLYCRSFVAALLGWNINQIQPARSTYDGKSWWQSLMALKANLDAVRQHWAAEQQREPATPEAGDEDFYGPLMVDFAIVAAVMAIVVSILWMRRRR